jgi:hypothetical protein
MTYESTIPKITDRASPAMNGEELIALLELFHDLYETDALPTSLENFYRHISAVAQIYPNKPYWSTTNGVMQ